MITFFGETYFLIVSISWGLSAQPFCEVLSIKKERKGERKKRKNRFPTRKCPKVVNVKCMTSRAIRSRLQRDASMVKLKRYEEKENSKVTV